MKPLIPPLLAVLFTVFTVSAQQKTVTIATVNNPAMIELKRLSPKFEEKNPDIKLNWGIPEFQSFGTVVGQNISGALAGKMSVEQALKDGQAAVSRALKQAGYLK